MWGYVSKSIRNTLRRHKIVHTRSSRNRSVIKKNKYEAESSKQCLPPSVVNFDKQGFGSTKEDKTRGESRWETKHSWQDAFRWTSVAAIGWAFCQSLCISKKLDEFWNKSVAQIPLDFQLKDVIAEIKGFEPRKMLSISRVANSIEDENEDRNIPIAFGSINHEEFDMLLHRQQSF